jgi:hypothetical protein
MRIAPKVFVPDPFPDGPYHLLMDGQSLANTPVGNSCFTQTVALLNPANWPTSYNAAVSGSYYFERKNSGTIPGTTRVDPNLSGVNSNVMVDIAGQSDLYLGLATEYTAQELLDIVEVYVAERKVADSELIYVVCTIPIYAGIYANAQDVERLAYNEMLTTGDYTFGLIDGVADIASIPELQNYANPTYFSDGLHWTAAGAGLGAQKIVDSLSLMGLEI